MATFDPQAQRKALNRLRRARGQLDAVINAVENQHSCRDIIIQLSAVCGALDRAGFTMISSAMQNCLIDDAAPADPQASGDAAASSDGQGSDGGRGSDDGKVTMAELEKLFLMLA